MVPSRSRSEVTPPPSGATVARIAPYLGFAVAAAIGFAFLIFNPLLQSKSPPPNPVAENTAVSDGDRSPGEASYAKADQRVYVNPNSLAGKILKADENAQRVTGLSKLEREQNVAFIVNAFYRPGTSEEFYAELHQDLVNTYGVEEADFLMSVAGANDWEAARNMIEQRQRETGVSYGNLLLNTGLIHGDISADEITLLVRDGVQLPSSAVSQLAASGRAEVIASLVERGIPIDLNYRDPVLGTNAVEVLIQNIGYFPDKFEPTEAAEALRTLVSLGVDAMPQDGSLGPLDYALDINRSNAGVKLAMAKVLLEQGVPFQESHRELLAQMPDCPEREHFRELFANHL